MKTAPILLLIGIAVATLACGTPAEPDARRSDGSVAPLVDGFALAIDRKVYRIGDSIAVELANRGGEPIGYNGCYMARELLIGGGWRRIESLRLCAAVLYTLDPEASVQLAEEVSAEWQPGSYRLVLQVAKLRSGRDLLLYSPTFEVEH